MDEYDIYIKELTEKYNYFVKIANLDEWKKYVCEEWKSAKGIFKFMTNLACPLMIRAGSLGPTPELTLLIQADDRIPTNINNIVPDNFQAFAEWHRKHEATTI